MITRRHVKQLVNALSTAATIVEEEGLRMLRAGNRAGYDNARIMVTNWRSLVAEVDAAMPQDGAAADPSILLG